MESNKRFQSQAYLHFLEEVIHCGCLWGLQGPEGWALSESDKYADCQVMPFWSQPELAEPHCCDDWQHYQVVPVSLEEFLDDWLPGMHKDELLVGINWDESLIGEEVEPLDLLADIDEAARQ